VGAQTQILAKISIYDPRLCPQREKGQHDATQAPPPHRTDGAAKQGSQSVAEVLQDIPQAAQAEVNAEA
jgi:hypothetical protein